MTDRRPDIDPTEPERQLGDHRRAMPHSIDPTETASVGEAPDRAPGPRRSPSLLRVALTTAAAVVLLVVLIGTRFMPAAGPGSATGSAGPTFNLPAALTAQVDTAGLMRSGGIWAAQGSYLLTSTDGGATWEAGQLPTPYLAIYVLDPDHAWTIGAVHDPSGRAAPSIPAAGLVVNRTVDGGRTWQQATMSGLSCRAADLAFADANRGFLICPGSVTIGSGAPASGPDADFRTEDGGATWSVAGPSSGLGITFAVSDANTLWSAPDLQTSKASGFSLQVSRDAGLTWSKVALPEVDSQSSSGAMLEPALGPTFWDASNGSLAVDAYTCVQNRCSAQVWFYRTSDGGLTWTLVKEPTNRQAFGSANASVVVGRLWTMVGEHGFQDLSVSPDFGATWTDIAPSGLPSTSAWFWIDFTDKDHGAGIVYAAPMARVLLLTSDGGRTWHAAGFGDARAQVTAAPALDAAEAAKIAQDFQTYAVKVPASAWNSLSSYSQRQFGSEAAFESTEAALAKRTSYGYQVGAPTQSEDVRNRANLGTAVWDDVTRFAVMSRTFVVVVAYPGTSEPPRKLVVAPLSATGEWRVWVATSR